MLNAHYAALRVISARRAVSLLFKRNQHDLPVAEVVHLENGRFVSYDPDDWQELSVLQRECEPDGFDWIRAVRFDLAVPRIIRVLTYAKVRRPTVRLNRRTILARDRNRCQYCGQKFPAHELSLDHVIPRSQNGPLSWVNIVCSCLKCNVRKGGRTPERAGMKLISKPRKPAGAALVSIRVSDRRYGSWRHFLDQVHWNIDTR